jgi:hypothetical protein
MMKGAMNAQTTKSTMNAGAPSALAACLDCCRTVVTEIGNVREAILADSRSVLRSQERLLRLALNEAEALAWDTTFPHLVFPTLALEKVQALADWSARQKSVRRGPAGVRN